MVRMIESQILRETEEHNISKTKSGNGKLEYKDLVHRRSGCAMRIEVNLRRIAEITEDRCNCAELNSARVKFNSDLFFGKIHLVRCTVSLANF